MTGDARFCRKCGQASTRFAAESVTEGTTRILQTPEANNIFGQEFYEQHGSLAQPTTPIPPQATQTARNLPAEPKRQNWLMFGALVFVGLALVAVALVFTLRGNSTSTTPTSVVIKRGGIPSVPEPPQPPTVPQAPIDGSNAFSPDLIYPGAKVTMQVIGSPKGNVLQLKTSDSFEKVVEWYTGKLSPKNIVRPPGADNAVAVLNADALKAIITADGSNGTNILLTQGDIDKE